VEFVWEVGNFFFFVIWWYFFGARSCGGAEKISAVMIGLCNRNYGCTEKNSDLRACGYTFT